MKSTSNEKPFDVETNLEINKGIRWRSSRRVDVGVDEVRDSSPRPDTVNARYGRSLLADVPNLGEVIDPGEPADGQSHLTSWCNVLTPD